MKNFLISFYIALIVLLVGSTQIFSQTGTIQGTVTDTLTHVPLVSATLTLEGTGFGVITDLAGQYSLSVPVGTYIMHAIFPGFVEETVNVSVNAGKITIQNFGLFPVRIFVVVNTNDSGPGSLRQAILDANAHPGKDEIHFNIPGAGPFTIQPITSLPQIIDPVLIDGYSQPGASANTNQPELGTNAILKIEIDGINAGGSGLNFLSGNSTVRGLSIYHFDVSAISLETGGGNIIEGNFLGTDALGIAGYGNRRGILIAGSNNNKVGGTSPGARNLISANYGRNISIGGPAIGNVIQGNLIGCNITGSAALGTNGISVLFADADSNIIGGTTAGERNIIVGSNTLAGIVIQGKNNFVQGNFVGTNVTGTAAVGDTVSGILINNGSNNIIGGSASGARNLISGNGKYGLWISGDSTAGFANENIIKGNLIGTDINGTHDLGNDGGGILIGDYSTNNIVGGPDPNDRNIISGNGSLSAPGTPGTVPGTIHGIVLEGINCSHNSVQGNFIGTDLNGEASLGNGGDGVQIRNGANNNTIGGINPGEGNVISGNYVTAVAVYGNGTNNNFVCGNLIGLNANGTANIGHPGGTGVYLGLSASGNHIGGPSPGAGNFITGSGWAGVYANYNALNNEIIGNYFGTDINKNAGISFSNNIGILLKDVSGFKIGDTTSGASNLIANSINQGLLDSNVVNSPIVGNELINNGGTGIDIVSGTSNSIFANSISGNGGLGIDLGNDGVTANDSLDADTGPNNLQNFPVLISAGVDDQIISGVLHSSPGASFKIEFFNSVTPDPSGYGEGETFIGSISNVTTDVYGDAQFNVYLPGKILYGKYFTSTATDAAGNTSEFSQSISVSFDTKTFGKHYVVNTTQAGIPLHWKDGKANYEISNSVPANFVSAIQEGFNTWSTTPQLNGNINYTNDGTTNSTQWGGSPDGKNNVVWFTSNWNDSTETDNKVVAVTRVRYNALNGEMTDVDIAFNADQSIETPFKWATNGDTSSLDIQNVSTHEIGHFSGLGDIYNKKNNGYWIPEMGDSNDTQTMFGMIKNGETIKRDLYYDSGHPDEGDVGGINYIYNNIPQNKFDLVLVFDNSKNFAEDYNALSPAKKSAVELIDKMRVGDRVSIVSFPDNLVLPLTEITNDASRISIKNSINSITIGSTCSIGSALNTAQNQLVTSGRAKNEWVMIL
ncbi:MAG TPA: carboxypeptidase-like regulatory domain-containing protein, partial [Ignavibacteriaceae bacterium]|nr:carboxypeptidase-like regulatory domain-containing protein [Ignavibacteriaceae bacterium]